MFFDSLDLDNFAIAQPEVTNHICNTDQFLVSGGSPVPTICGTSHGDHSKHNTLARMHRRSLTSIDVTMILLYCIQCTLILAWDRAIQLWSRSSPAVPRFRVRGAFALRRSRATVSRRPNKDVSSITPALMVDCKATTMTQRRGDNFPIKITAFAYAPNETFAVSNTISVRTWVYVVMGWVTFPLAKFVRSMQYNVRIWFLLANNRSRSFTLTGNSNAAVMSMVGAGAAGTPNICAADWILIPCAKVADRLPTPMTCEDRLCGGALSAELGTTARTITSKQVCAYLIHIIYRLNMGLIMPGNVRPFRVTFHADSIEAPTDVDNRGFCLDYVQQPCTNGK